MCADELGTDVETASAPTTLQGLASVVVVVVVGGDFSKTREREAEKRDGRESQRTESLTH